MSQGDNHIGSDELTQAEFNAYDKEHEKVLEELYEVIHQSQQAKDFLNTKFGLALRQTLVAEKLKAMKACAESIGTSSQSATVLQYSVIKKVEQIFGMIISDGDAALRQLQVMEGIGDDNAKR